MRRFLLTFIWISFTANAFAGVMPNFMEETPVGSWVTTEEKIQRGKKTEVMHITRSLVGEEIIDGKRHVWLEIKTQVFKVNRKGETKPKGEVTLVKMLTDTSVFDGNFTNTMSNIQKVARKIYIKSGDQVMDMSGGGALAGFMLKASDAQFKFDIKDLGESRNFETPFGRVSAHKYHASGDGEMKVLIKTITTHSETDMWMSADIPFGMVESQTTTIVNGKQESSSSRVLAGAKSGAQSEIDISQATENPLAKFKFGNH